MGYEIQTWTAVVLLFFHKSLISISNHQVYKDDWPCHAAAAAVLVADVDCWLCFYCLRSHLVFQLFVFLRSYLNPILCLVLHRLLLLFAWFCSYLVPICFFGGSCCCFVAVWEACLKPFVVAVAVLLCWHPRDLECVSIVCVLTLCFNCLCSYVLPCA